MWLLLMHQVKKMFPWQCFWNVPLLNPRKTHLTQRQKCYCDIWEFFFNLNISVKLIFNLRNFTIIGIVFPENFVSVKGRRFFLWSDSSSAGEVGQWIWQNATFNFVVCSLKLHQTNIKRKRDWKVAFVNMGTESKPSLAWPVKLLFCLQILTHLSCLSFYTHRPSLPSLQSFLLSP